MATVVKVRLKGNKVIYQTFPSVEAMHICLEALGLEVVAYWIEDPQR